MNLNLIPLNHTNFYQLLHGLNLAPNSWSNYFRVSRLITLYTNGVKINWSSSSRFCLQFYVTFLFSFLTSVWIRYFTLWFTADSLTICYGIVVTVHLTSYIDRTLPLYEVVAKSWRMSFKGGLVDSKMTFEN